MTETVEERAWKLTKAVWMAGAPEYTQKFLAQALTAAEQRGLERAAQMVETHVPYYRGNEPVHLVPSETGDWRGKSCAAAIRALAKEESP